jgi:hypothetical protein
MKWAYYWIGFLATSLLLNACDVPTEYTVNSPECPWPPPKVTDQAIQALPLGCPYMLEDGTIVGGWWSSARGVGGSAGGLK